MKSFFLSLFVGITTVFGTSCNNADCEPGGDPSACVCPTVIDPVCGCDNITYENSCRAECAGITDYTSGECE